MATVAELLVRIGADVGGALADLRKFGSEAESGFKKAEAGSQMLAGALAGVGVGVAAWAVSSVKALGEQEKAMAQTSAVIKSTGGAAHVSALQISEMANALEAKTGVDDMAIQKGQNLLLTFTNIKNGVGANNDIFNQATKVMLDMSVAMGTDASGGAIQLGKALNSPKDGLTALTRVGVTFSEAQKAQITAMQAAGNVAGAQKIILAELNREFGGSAVAAGNTLPGAMAKAQNAMEDLGKAVFKDVMPALTAMANEGTKAITDFTSKVEAIGLRDTLESWIGPSEGVRLAILAVAGAVTAALIPAMVGAGTAIATAMIPLAPFAAAGAAVVALGYGLYKAWQNLPHMFEAIGATWNLVKSMASNFGASVDLTFKQMKAQVLSSVEGLVNGVRDWLGNKLKAAMDLVTNPVAAAKKAFFSLYDAVVGHSYIPDMVKEVGQHMSTLDKHLAGHAEKHTSDAAKAFKKMQAAVSGTMSDMAAKITEAGVEFKVTGDRSAYLESKLSATKSAMVSLLKAGVSDAAPQFQALRGQFEQTTTQLKLHKDAADASAEATRHQAEMAALAVKPFEDYGASLVNAEQRLAELTTRQALFGDAGDLAAQKVQVLNEQLVKAVTVYGENSTEVARLREQIQGATADYEATAKGIADAAKVSADAYAKIGGDIRSWAGAVNQVSDSTVKGMEKLGVVTKEQGDTMSNALSKAASTGAAFGSTVTSIATGNWPQAIASGVQMATGYFDGFFQTLVNGWKGVQSWFSGHPIAMNSSGDLVDLTKSASGLAAAAVSALPKNLQSGQAGSYTQEALDYAKKAGIRLFADGGIVTRPTLGIFGEAGPEAVIPLSRMGSMGGQTINITVTGNTIMNDRDANALGQAIVRAAASRGLQLA
jgi:hypothetical protein